MNSETDIGIKFTASVNGNNKLEKLANNLAIIKGVADGINVGSLTAVEDTASSTKDIAKNTGIMAHTMKLAFNFSTVRMFARTLGNITKEFTKMATASSDYLENINLFQVAFDGTYRSAEKFVDKITEMYGLDESRITRVVGIFKQLANAMNVSAQTGEKLAELMTEMSLDISSLYNIDFERATSVLQSAFSGQTKPIRGATGADITQSTLQTTLNGLGIDKMVSDLSFAEKRLLIIISLTEQLKEATNDLGRTIESPANQLKVLSEQWSRLTRALGNSFLPILAKILPYLNAILMVLTEIINMIAKLFGYKAEDYDYFSGTSDAVMELEDSLGKATAGAGKLKKSLQGLRSFDKLNVISTPASGGGASAGGGLGKGLDPDILNAFDKAFDSYNEKLDTIKMKASKIRDSIMEWLGFTKEIDPETGKIVWKYQGFGKTIKNLRTWFKELSPIAKALVQFLTIITANKILKGVAKLIGLFTNITPIKTMNTQFGKMCTYISTISSSMKSKKDGFLMGIDTWKAEASAMERVQTAIGGIITAGVGLSVVSASMQDINDKGLNLLNTVGLVGGELTSVFGGAMAGAAIGGGWGAVIGGIAGGISGLITAIFNYESEQDKIAKKAKEALEDVRKTTKELKKEMADTEMEIASAMSLTNYHEKLKDELNQIIDKNGDIKKGYEDRAQFILKELSNAYGVEYKLVDGNLQNQKEFNEKIEEAIRLKEQEILLEAYKQDYIDALKRKNELYGEYNKQLKNQESTLTSLNAVASDYGLTYREYQQILKDTGGELDKNNEKHRAAAALSMELKMHHQGEVDALKKYDKAVKESGTNYQNNAELISRYADFQTAVETGDMDKINEARDKYTEIYVKDGKVIIQSEQENMNQRAKDYETDLKTWKKNNDERYSMYKQNLTDITKATDEATPEIVQKWVALGNTSRKDFIEEFSKLEDDMQTEIISKMYNDGYQISDQLQKGLDAFDVTKEIKIDYDEKKTRQKFEKIFGKIDWVQISGGGTASNKKVGQNAVGGMPKVGQLFIANERGPELIGQIGGQSFVANQNQMMELLDNKIGNAQGNNKSNDVYNIYLDANHKIGTYTLEQLESMAKTNGKPIKIG